MVRATKVLLDGYGVPESLRWHQGALYFVDMAAGTLHRWTEAGGEDVLGTIPGRAGGLGFLPNGDMLIVSMDQHVIWRRSADGDLTQHADISAYCGGHANDMMVTPEGYAYVGNFGFDYHAFHRANANSHLYKPPGPPSTRVVCIAPDGTIEGTGPDMLFPNGTVQLPGGSIVVAETLRLQLTECDVDEHGVLMNPRPYAKLMPDFLWNQLNSGSPLGAIVRTAAGVLENPHIANAIPISLAPDGIDLDSDGQSIWIANATRAEVVLVRPGGHVVERIRTGNKTLDVTLGGVNGRTLFCATTINDDPTIGGPARNGCIEFIDLDGDES